MVWSERAVRQHWLWHRLRLLDLASGELAAAAGLAGRRPAANHDIWKCADGKHTASIPRHGDVSAGVIGDPNKIPCQPKGWLP